MKTDIKIDRQTDRQTDRTDPVGMGIYSMQEDGGTSSAGSKSTKAVADHSGHSHGTSFKVLVHGFQTFKR